MIADSRVGRIRSLATEAQVETARLMDELDTWNPDHRHLQIVWNYQRRVINKMNMLEAK